MKKKFKSLEELRKRIWSHSPKQKGHTFEKFSVLFYEITDRGWDAVDQSLFQCKEECAQLYWTDFQEKNLRKQDKKKDRRKGVGIGFLKSELWESDWAPCQIARNVRNVVGQKYESICPALNRGNHAYSMSNGTDGSTQLMVTSYSLLSPIKEAP